METGVIDPLQRLKNLFNTLVAFILESYQVIVIVIAVLILAIIGFLYLVFRPL